MCYWLVDHGGDVCGFVGYLGVGWGVYLSRLVAWVLVTLVLWFFRFVVKVW